METLLIIGVIIVIIGAIAWSIYAAAKRRKELGEWAASKGLSFYDAKDYSFDEQYPTFNVLRRGANRYAHNHLTGTYNDHDFHGFDYHYETYSTDSKGRRQTHHHHFSCVILNSPIPLQELFIRPEGFFDKVTELFGANDIDFESLEFSKKFFVKAPDKKWAFDVIHQRTMEFLLDAPRFTIQFERESAIVFRSNRFSPLEFGEAADVVLGIWERFPDYLINQQLGKS